MVTTLEWIGLFAMAFLPPLLFLIYVRNQERYEREPMGRIILIFVFAAIVSVALAVLFEALFETGFQREYDVGGIAVKSLVLAVLVAPFVEELTKAFGVFPARGDINEEEDGIVYGVAAGLGFASMENLFYGIVSLQEAGTSAYLATAILRSLTGTFLHATATGIVGYGIGKMIMHKGSVFDVLPYYALAVLLHAAFNLLAVTTQFALAVGFLVLVSFLAIRWTIHRIRRFDRSSLPPGPTLFPPVR